MTTHQALRITWLDCLVCFATALALTGLGLAIIIWEMLT